VFARPNAAGSIRVLGIDPGLTRCGYAVVDGLGGRAGNAESGAAPGSSNLAEQAVTSALRYRSQAPIIDALLKEVGLSSDKSGGLGSTLAKEFDRGDADEKKG